MILVVGGLASGKRSYVRSLGYDDEQMGSNVRDGKPVLVELEELLRTGPLDDADFAHVASRDVVCCCEVGMGVVPMDAGERIWRERVGRTCSMLASQATRVVRMVCGIPTIIKDGDIA